MKSIATRIASILATALIAATTLFTTHVTAQEVVKIPVSEVFDLIKNNKMKYKTPDNIVFLMTTDTAGQTIYVRRAAGGISTMSKIVSVDKDSSFEICYQPFTATSAAACMYLTKSGDKILLHRTFTIQTMNGGSTTQVSELVQD